jgi:hypothetical protein
MTYTIILGAFFKTFKNIRWHLSESESREEKIGNEFTESSDMQTSHPLP